MPSVYFPNLASSDRILILSGEEFHHLARVARVRVGDVVMLNSGKGMLARARVMEIGKREAKLEIDELMANMQFPAPYAIAFSLLKNRHDELLVEKCTELGAGQFFPMVCDFSIRKSANDSRLERIALAAIKQCDNPILPVLEQPTELKAVLVEAREYGYTPILCSELKPDLWLDDLKLPAETKPCFFIGPEGGWSESEIGLFEKERVASISIGHLITRAETAAITIAAQWVAYANRLRTSGTK